MASVNMSEFFNYMRGLEAKWDAKFQMQEEHTAKKIEEMESKIEMNRLIREYESSAYINNHISDTNTKMSLASGGVALIGVLITPIPIIGLVGVGITLASTINGIVHVAINSDGKVKMTNELLLGKLIKANPGCSLHEAVSALEFLHKWMEENPKPGRDEDHSNREHDRNYYNRIPKSYYNINLEPLLH